MKELSKENLLFGVFAWRLGFINRDQLAHAVKECLTEKSEALLADKLLDLGIVNEEQQREIHQLLNAQLNRHAGNAEKSLASLSFDHSTLVSLTEDTDKPEHGDSFSNDETKSEQLQPINTEIARGDFFAKGGLGKIYRSTDQSLGRQVAVKELNEKLADHPVAQERFRREARITSQLQHPGIVPVYGLGGDAAGRPYYTMRLVEGEELRERISKFHSGTIDFHSLKFQELLDCLVDVAQTVSYAHSQGVIHRDLKPANILVGQFGETVVVDWGLAKAQATDNDDSRLNMPSTQNDTATRADQILGTIGYAAPEQLGESKNGVDDRTDIYSLGAILYYMLTGQHTVATDKDLERLIETVRKGDIPNPRKLVSSAPAALDAIAMKALSSDRNNRYQSAQEFIDDINRWNADLPVSASTESMSEKISRLARKHQNGVFAIVASLLVISIISGIALYFVNESRISEADQRYKAERLADEKSDLSEEKSKLAEQKTELAQSYAEEKVVAEIAGAKAQTSLDYLLKAFNRPRSHNDGNKVTVVQALEPLIDELINDENAEPNAAASLLTSIGQIFKSMESTDLAIKALENSIRINKGLEKPDNVLLVRSHQHLAESYQRAGKHDDVLPQMDLAVGYLDEMEQNNNDPETVAEQLRLVGAAYDILGHPDKGLKLKERSLKILEGYLEPSDESLIAAITALGASYWRIGDSTKSLETTKKALDLAKKHLGKTHRRTVMLLNNYGAGLYHAQKLSDASDVLKETLKIETELNGPNSNRAIITLQNIARIQFDLRHFDEAAELAEDSLDRMVQSGRDSPSASAEVELFLGRIEAERGNFDRAIELANKVIELRKKNHGDEHPETLAASSFLAQSFMKAGRLKESIDLYRRLIEIGNKSNNPNTRDLRERHSWYAKALLENENAEKALEQYDVLLKMTEEKLAKDHPDYFRFMSLRAKVLLELDRTDEAVAQQESAYHGVLEKLGAKSRRTINVGINYGESLVQSKQNDKAKAILKELEKTVESSERPDSKQLNAIKELLKTIENQ